MEYDFKTVEFKWQKKWEEKKIFKVKEDSKKKKFYVLDMFPYPSGEGLHMGHAFVFSLGDIFARFKRLQGYNVLYPIGYDSLGLPAENAAIKKATHPEVYTSSSILNFMKQQKAMGWSYDWGRMFKTSDPGFYKWDQWIFLQMLKRGLVYKKKSAVNWCSKCQTVLANEQVHSGRCWRHEDTFVEIKQLEQWYFKITNYAEELLQGLDKLNWPERAKIMQKNWIGKSYGTEILFEIPTNSITKIYLASKNKSKLERLKKIFSKVDPNIEIEFVPKFVEVEETEKDILDNSLKKVLPYKNKYNYPVIAGDTAVFFDGEDFDPTHVKRICLKGQDQSKFSQEEIAGKIKNFYIQLAKKYKGKKDFYYEDGWTILFPDGSYKQTRYKREYILTDKSQGPLDIYFPMRSLYLVKATGKNVYSQSEEEYFKEFAPQIDALKKLISNIWPIFTTRPDTIFGVTFMVVSAHHPILMELVAKEQKKKVEDFLKKLKSTSEKDVGDLNKEGVFTGSYAINPVNNKKVPIWVGNFVLADYGSGMVMAVPAHDQRDFEFAKKYKLEIKQVIKPEKGEFDINKKKFAYKEYGTLINSGNFNGLSSEEAVEHISIFLKEKKLGKKTFNYKLKDWLISRQRYWGTPIPVVYCNKCGVVAISEKELPIKLPRDVKFGKGNPLATNEKWINTKCPKCNGKAKRETDTMDTFVNSSWYFLRYCDPQKKNQIFDKKKVDYWCPIDQYIGGPEHITMHLIYIRFYTKFLRDLGLLKFDEPALRYFTQGVVKSGGNRMSKSKGNVIEPLDTINKYGADSLRLYLTSASSPDSDFDWDEGGIQGSFKFLNKVYEYFEKFKPGKTDARIESKLNKTIKEITNLVEGFKHNLAIIHLRNFFDYIQDKKIDKKTAESFLKLLHIYCPFITEELWEKLGNKGFISLEKWPIVDEKKINERFEKEEELIEGVINDINNVVKIIRDKGNEISTGYIYAIPGEINIYLNNALEIEKRIGLKIKVFAVNDKDKYDPSNKSKKVTLGRPGIYLE